MTRPQLERLFLDMYAKLMWLAERQLPGRGADAVHGAYMLMIENRTYTRASRGPVRGQQWIWQKVRKEIYKIKQQPQDEPLEDQDE